MLYLEMKRVTIHDVVAEANVSLATVDRVINNRLGVREKTIDRVNQAIKKLGYTRDLSAANLAKRREYRIRFILPEGDNSFMFQIKQEIGHLMHVKDNNRTFIDVLEVPAFDAGALTDALDNVPEDSYTGVVFVAVDSAVVRDAVARLKDRGLIPVTLVSDIPSAPRAHFVGINNIAAGRTAASLMGRFLTSASTHNVNGKIVIVAGSMLLKDHLDRRLGFEQVLKAEYPSLGIFAVVEGGDDRKITEKLLDDLFQKNPDIMGLYSLAAAKQGVIRSLKKQCFENKVCTIAHDLTRESRAALMDGTFDAVITQDPPHQVRSAVRVIKNCADDIAISVSEERIRIDIYIRDNLAQV